MSEVEKADLGVVGLAVMGANLARNAARKGFGVALFNRHGEPTDALMRSHGSEGRFVPSKELPDFVASLKTPRIAIFTVKAGKSVDEIMPHVEPGDILVDAGNSLFTDTQRRVKTCEAKSVRFVGMGVSGGEEGALNEPSMMPGGDRATYDGSGVRAAPAAPTSARMARANTSRCCTTASNAETYDILKSVYGLDASAISDVRARSILIAITEAVYARALSSRRELRSTLERFFPHPQTSPRKAAPAEIDALRDAALRGHGRRLRAGL